ncbi:MAG TPA: head GIN domain-containing protein [Thermomicrobiales bacterium]|jgi:hypothetical protein
MRRLIFASVVGVVVAIAVGGYRWWQADQTAAYQGSGIVVSEPREVAGFTDIDLSGTGSLHLTQGETETLTVRTDDNILPLIQTEVRDGTLRIWIDGRGHPHGIGPTQLSYEVGVKSLAAITVSGAAQIETGSLVGDDLRLNVSGSAQVSLVELTATSLHVDSTGGSSFAVAGTVDQQAITINGAGEYQAKGLASRSAIVEVNGAGHAAVRVGEELNVTVNGAGVVEYLGNPKVQQQVQGVGVVRQITQ